MNTKTKTTRLSIALTEPIYKAIQQDAITYGLSMSAYCTFIIGQYYATKERMLNATQLQMNELMIGMANDLKKF